MTSLVFVSLLSYYYFLEIIGPLPPETYLAIYRIISVKTETLKYKIKKNIHHRTSLLSSITSTTYGPVLQHLFQTNQIMFFSSHLSSAHRFSRFSPPPLTIRKYNTDNKTGMGRHLTLNHALRFETKNSTKYFQELMRKSVYLSGIV